MKKQSQEQRMLTRISRQGGMEAILDRIASGESLTSVARSLGVSRHVLGGVLNRDPELKAALRQSRECAADLFAEEALEIADKAANETVDAARLQINARLWLAARLCPGRYGRQARARSQFERL